MKNIIKKTIYFAGRSLTLEVGRLAQQATSAVLATYGETTVLATVVVGAEDLKKDYAPISIEYQERLYAGGRIKGSRWVKREGRGTDAEILAGRVVDRSVRPLFPKNWRREVQIIITVLSVDKVNDPVTVGLVAVSAALSISPITWDGPVAGVRIGLINNELVVSPQNDQIDQSTLDLFVTSSKDLVVMLEAGSQQVPEDQMFAAIKLGYESAQPVLKLISDLVTEVSPVKLPKTKVEYPAGLVEKVTKKAHQKVVDYITTYSIKEGGDFKGLVAELSADLDDTEKSFVPVILEELFYETIRTNILDKAKRPDGRKMDEIRKLEVSVGVLPRVHGSAIFQRGQTQALTITTLGSPSDSQTTESAEGEGTKHYFHHYNFPPYSTGETGKIGNPGRREIGHGALAEKALLPVLPSQSEFPYTIRVVSEIMSSNGSTSMASTCGSTLSLMDAGVPLLSPVAGISIGLVDTTLLTDIIGMEDHYTDMDFKVAGTNKGITAIQLDVKVPGLTLDIVKETLTRAKVARLQILDAMLKVIPAPRKELSQYAPKISTASIPVDKIGELIGPGGKNIKKLMADFGVDIDVNDTGAVFVTGVNTDGVQKALSYLKSFGKEIEVGEVYEGTVVNLPAFGAFVNILPGRDGLVHVSQMAQGYVSDPNSIVQLGQTVRTWVTDVDSTTGKVGLSMLFDESGQPFVKPKEARQDRDSAPRPQGFFSAPRRDDRRGHGGRPIDRSSSPRPRY